MQTYPMLRYIHLVPDKLQFLQTAQLIFIANQQWVIVRHKTGNQPANL